MTQQLFPLIKAHTQVDAARAWCRSVRGLRPLFACAMGFTETALVPGISAAGATPEARRWTAIADAEVLLHNHSARLPTAPEGFPSPVVISQALCTSLDIPVQVFDCGLPQRVPGATLAGSPSVRTAACLSTGQAMSVEQAGELFGAGQEIGRSLSQEHPYLAVGECVAGGTTTALALLMGLGIEANGMVNSSHPVCNHRQKLELVNQGLIAFRQRIDKSSAASTALEPSSLETVAAIGDPMQPFVAGMTLAASCHCPVLLAGGTQMLAVYALAQRLATERNQTWNPQNVAVGTTRWVAGDPTGQTTTLAQLLPPVALLATQLSLAESCFPQLQAYERGYVKEGVGAGGLAIAASLYANLSQVEFLSAIESTYAELLQATAQT
ncbi:MAG: nicotinate mononucleotide-dependent phosphoribosyltransferase CobT [Synechococcus sp.]